MIDINWRERVEEFDGLKHLYTYDSNASYNNDYRNIPNISNINNNTNYHQDPNHNNSFNYNIDYSQKYFTIKSLENNNAIKYYSNNKNTAVDIYISTDNGLTWTDVSIPKSSTKTLITLNKGREVLLKSTNASFGSDGSAAFKIDKFCALEGNIMSLRFGDDFRNKTTIYKEGESTNASAGASGCFMSMFSNCKIIYAKNLVLPATTLMPSCYQSMFRGCIYMISGPRVLPATSLKQSCYCNMFSNCKSLITSPDILATSLFKNACGSMFYNCSSLSYIKALFKYVDTVNNIYARNWVKGVAKNGTFVKNPAYTSISICTHGIPEGWTIIDNS